MDDDEMAYREEVMALYTWCLDNNLSLNVSKTREMIVDYRKRPVGEHQPIHINGVKVERLRSPTRVRTEPPASRHPEMTSSLVLVSWLVLVLQVVADDEHGIKLHPPRVVVRHGDPVSVNCTVSIDCIMMYWADNCAAKLHASREAVTHGVNYATSIVTLRCREDTHGNNFITLRVNIRDYCANYSCHVIPKRKPECKKDLSVTVYKPPDSVSVSSIDSTDPMVEGSQYQLKCEIQNIAPVQNLTVKWYKGDTLVHGDRDYVIEDGKSDREKEPVSVSSTLLITPSRADDGAEYSCEAELDLGPEGPQPPLAVKSEPLRITVHSPPRRTFWTSIGVVIAVLLLVSICVYKQWNQKRKEADRLPNSSDPLISVNQRANNGTQILRK
ncbi:intercellular adhesion molecule 1-like [Paramormyrops kingsleyae]|uniref:intercellular adhesion molecule 1-like n=1 Tax=Paramormyrops kingsleyae TaxID=1676925 RepID=UPI003B96D72B